MTREDEKRIALLAALISLGGEASKKAALDYLDENSLLNLMDSDLRVLASNNEVKWRNSLAYTRLHLVSEGYLSNDRRNLWSITSAGVHYARDLADQTSSGDELGKFAHLDKCAALIFASGPAALSDEHAESRISERQEGREVRRWITMYEREPRLRAEAIRLHGVECMGCGFDFGRRYGDIGHGYIEVHHLRPVSEGLAKVDPAVDLVVLCSNCHSMVHRRKGVPMPLSELRKLCQVPDKVLEVNPQVGD